MTGNSLPNEMKRANTPRTARKIAKRSRRRRTTPRTARKSGRIPMYCGASVNGIHPQYVGFPNPKKAGMRNVMASNGWSDQFVAYSRVSPAPSAPRIE
jgi:hypothetical protein